MKDNPQKAQAAKCPFYHRTADNSGLFAVNCEGLVPGGGIKVWFPSAEERDVHFYAFCADCYRHCEIWHAIMMAQYADDLEDDEDVLP